MTRPSKVVPTYQNSFAAIPGARALVTESGTVPASGFRAVFSSLPSE